MAETITQAVQAILSGPSRLDHDLTLTFEEVTRIVTAESDPEAGKSIDRLIFKLESSALILDSRFKSQFVSTSLPPKSTIGDTFLCESKENRESKYVGCFIPVGNKVLMVREHFAGKPTPRNLAFPGGTREGKELYFQTILRELDEETGLKVGRIGSHLMDFGPFSLYACELEPVDKLLVFLRIYLEGTYEKKGPEGERIHVTLVNPETVLTSTSGVDTVQQAYGPDRLALEYPKQLKSAYSQIKTTPPACH